MVTNYEPLAQVWADKIPAKGAEKFIPGSGVTVATRAATWRVNYMPGVTETMRVVDDERRVWGIIGIAVEGFNRFLDLICQSDGTRLPAPEPDTEDTEAKGVVGEDAKPDELPKPATNTEPTTTFPVSAMPMKPWSTAPSSTLQDAPIPTISKASGARSAPNTCKATWTPTCTGSTIGTALLRCFLS